MDGDASKLTTEKLQDDKSENTNGDETENSDAFIKCSGTVSLCSKYIKQQIVNMYLYCMKTSKDMPNMSFYRKKQ